MQIATWNVNSIRARKDRTLAWLETHQPDVLCLQETKVTDEVFPRADFEALGYEVTACGQKTYNGAALLSRTAPTDVTHRFDDDAEEPEARFLSAKIAGIRIICVYVPNGQVVGNEKYTYKLAWLAQLQRYLGQHCDPTEPLLLCGDLNIAPEDRDVCDPAEWADTVLCEAGVRDAFRGLCDWGLVDAFRLHHNEGKLYSWWDYRQLAFQKNQGLRIDHILVTQPLVKRSSNAFVDREARKGKGASDHAPVVAEFSE
jgi:exodeoxyribonuclease-3